MDSRPWRCGTLFLWTLLVSVGCSDSSSSDTSNGTGGTLPSSDGGVGGVGGTAGGSGTGGIAGSGGASGAAGTAGSGAGGVAGSGGKSPGLPSIGGCAVFTDKDDWNTDVSSDATDDIWTQNILDLVGNVNLHPDFGNSGADQYGIPVTVVPQDQALVSITFDSYPDESDPGPYPFPGPGQIRIEGGDPNQCSGDCHVSVVQQGLCMLYEGYACSYQAGWHCGNGAKWDLTKLSYGQRPKGWTSADAAGLAIAPGLIRFDEVAAGEIRHAIRFTLRCSRANYVKPATHFAVPPSCGTNPKYPPMGMRVRLKASYNIANRNHTAQVILTAMKNYGMILADNGSNFFFQGDVDARWTGDLDDLKTVPASEFEVVKPPPLEP